MSEDRLQQEIYLWFHNEYPKLRGLLFHPANGGSRSSREGAKFKSMGVFPGVADLLFIYQNQLYAIELKTQTGTQSKVQKTWEDRVKIEGVCYEIVRSLVEFKKIIIPIINEH
tara:strand:+ start:1158 stop:1496 length:339 start_codon:yes stop_codon:yes gene_type:complete